MQYVIDGGKVFTDTDYNVTVTELIQKIKSKNFISWRHASRLLKNRGAAIDNVQMQFSDTQEHQKMLVSKQNNSITQEQTSFQDSVNPIATPHESSQSALEFQKNILNLPVQCITSNISLPQSKITPQIDNQSSNRGGNSVLKCQKWTKENKETLKQAVITYGRDWELIQARYFPGKHVQNLKNQFFHICNFEDTHLIFKIVQNSGNNQKSPSIFNQLDGQFRARMRAFKRVQREVGERLESKSNEDQAPGT